ncbi:MAG: BMP family ABC transporter substrate-binding protein [Treponema sp.]|jgi:simple sugar transport system substrate-binding protein|nr:BMP family ABC transporter substrate-binding protein [Treponema sp.]
MKKVLVILLLTLVLFTLSCVKKNTAQDSISVLVFVTGFIAGSPPYEMMTEGALEFAQEHPNVKVKVYEAGINQAEWEAQLGEMVASGEYDVVIGSNPSLPEICVNILALFPNQKFIILDAYYEGNPQIRTYNYNQYEQSKVLGFLAGLITTSDMRYSNSQKRVGFIAAQEYPLLTREMIPGFLEGARLADSQIALDVRIIGSWADASKAAELASAMMAGGVDVFTAIAGSAAQGLIRVASERGAYIVWYNTNAYNLAPGVIVGCGIMEQKKLVMEILGDLIEGKIEYGTAQTIGIKEGYLGFAFDAPGYLESLPPDIRERFETYYNGLLP